MQTRAEHTGLPVGYGGEQGRAGRRDGATVGRRANGGSRRDGESRVLPFASRDARAARVGDMPIRRIPVIGAHLPMAAAREVAALKRIALLLVEFEEQIVGTVDETVLASTAIDETPTAAVMKPLDVCLRPAMSVAQARELFVRARATVLPVIAGGFVLGAVRRADILRTKPRTNGR